MSGLYRVPLSLARKLLYENAAEAQAKAEELEQLADDLAGDEEEGDER